MMGRNLYFCPKCKTKVEKVDGCNHMICIICNYEFCWICGGPYSDNHFVPFNPMGCGAGYYTPRRHWALRILFKLLYIIAFLVLFPILLVFFIPVYFGVGGGRTTYKFLSKRFDPRDGFRAQGSDRSRLCCGCSPLKFLLGFLSVLAGLFCAALGVLVNMIVAPVFLVVFIFCMMPFFFFVECS